MKKWMSAVAACGIMSQAQAGVTFTPMLGYDFMTPAHDKQRQALPTNAATAGGLPAGTGVGLKSDLVQSYALGVELTKNVDVEIEYQQVQTMAHKNKATIPLGEFDARKQSYSANALVYANRTGISNAKFRPYVLVGVGKTEIEAKDDALSGFPGRTIMASSKDTIANLGLGAKYAFSSNIALRAEGRLSYNTDHNWIEPIALVGVQWRFVSQMTPTSFVTGDYIPKTPVLNVVEVPLDSDNDGVIDPKDLCPNTPTEYAVDVDGCPKELLNNTEVQISVLFDSNKAEIKPEYNDDIGVVAQFLQKHPKVNAVIEGHTDSTGSEEFNQKLSYKRANAVRTMLATQYGVSTERLNAKGLGESAPIVPNDSSDNRQLNRRTVAVVKTTTKTMQLR